MRIGIVCPYSWSTPGGVQAHVRDLANALRRRGHAVSVLSPGDEDDLPELDDSLSSGQLTLAGKAVPIPYNGSVARLQFGLVSAARVRRWLRDGQFDVVHVHEPATPSLSLLACMIHDGPLVATFHMATERSRFLLMFDTVLQPFLEKLAARIAVSPAARAVVVEHLGGDAVVIPNGVDIAAFRRAAPLPGYPRVGGTVGFVGRYSEPRKGMDVLLGALEQLVVVRPGLQLLVAGRGDAEEFLDRLATPLRSRVQLLGQVSDEHKAALLASIDVYCAPNTGQESFGVILLEAMAARVPIVASDLVEFRRVLTAPGASRPAGELVAASDAAGMARALAAVLDQPARRQQLLELADQAVVNYDWNVISASIERVYELAVTVAPSR